MTINVDKKWFVDRLASKGLSQSQLAKMLGLDRSAISRLLSGDRVMKVAEVAKIATILNVSETEILKHAGGSSAVQSGDKRFDDSHSERVAPSFGFMKGLLTIESGYDLTSPLQKEWSQGM